MEFDKLFKQKKAIAERTIHLKEEIHGIPCIIEYLQSLDSVYGEDSAQKTYEKYKQKKRVIFVGTTQDNMMSLSDILNATEEDDIYAVRFEDDIFPRNTRIHIIMQEGREKIFEVRDNTTNEGTYVIRQQLIPTVNLNNKFNPEIGNNVKDDIKQSAKPIGNNI